MKGKSYLSIGSVSVGIAGSIVDTHFFNDYLGMRAEAIDMIELVRRIDEKIYEEEEFNKTLAWTKKYCKEGEDINKQKSSRQRKDYEWETEVKMTLIARDLMIGNPALTELGFVEESM